jgi:hypothetical protein
MADFPYTTNPGRIKPLLDKVKGSGIPDSVSIKTLQAWGFKSTNDRPLLNILKYLGFIDPAGTPSTLWKSYRGDKTSKAVLARAIRLSYGELFKLYPDANRKDTEALRHYFSTNSSVGSDTINFIVATFRRLCDLADFDAEQVNQEPPDLATKELVSTQVRVAAGKPDQGFVLNLNIQLTLPATENAAIYDSLFAAMKKHLLP